MVTGAILTFFSICGGGLGCNLGALFLGLLLRLHGKQSVALFVDAAAARPLGTGLRPQAVAIVTDVPRGD